MRRNFLRSVERFDFGNALYFDGINDSLDFFNSDTIASLNKISISLWCKTNNFAVSSNTSVANNRMWFNYNSSSANRITAAFRTASQGNAVYTATAVDGFLNADINHFVCVYDGTKTLDADRIKVYLNGNLLTGTPLLVPTSLNSNILQDLDIGFFFSNNTNGAIDEFALDVNYALNQSEVTALYNSKKGANYIYKVGRTPYIYCQMNENDGEVEALNIGTLAVNGNLNNFTTPPAYFKPFV